MTTMEKLLDSVGNRSLVLIGKIVETPTGTAVSGDFAMRGISKTEAIGIIETMKATIISETLRDSGIAFSGR